MTALAEPEAEPAIEAPAPPRTWHRPALLALLALTAVLYLWDLSASGWANAFYSAASQAGAESWKAWFFGSSDAANAITVDKTPAALWVTGLSARLFGVTAWSMLIPQALMGVGSVALLYATVKRVAGPTAALLAGAALALTPVAALMFRFNNPDALLVLLLVAGAYCVTRALEKADPRWLALAGVAVGFGFLAKMLQALLVLPAFGLAYLIAAPTTLGKRLLHLAGALAALVVSAGWYLLIVALWPVADRPYIGGSQNNSLTELVLGYNGLGRITGDETGSVGPSSWGATGWSRLFGDEMAGGIAWLLPAALVALGAGLWFTRRAGRTDRGRASLVLWGGWLLVTAATFSYMGGIIHPYYTVALAPAIAALVGIGATQLWRRREDIMSAALLASGVALTALMAYLLVARQSGWLPWLGPVVLFAGLAAAALLLFAAHLPLMAQRGVAVLALVATLAGTGAFTVATAASTHTGAIPSAGPSTGRGMRGGGGGLLSTSLPGENLTALLRKNGDAYTWVAATVGSNNAAGFQLGTDLPVMAVGGFNGTDAYPSLTQFQQYVQTGQIHFFLGDGMNMRSTSGSDVAQQISDWVAANFSATSVDGVTVYDLS